MDAATEDGEAGDGLEGSEDELRFNGSLSIGGGEGNRLLGVAVTGDGAESFLARGGGGREPDRFAVFFRRNLACESTR